MLLIWFCCYVCVFKEHCGHQINPVNYRTSPTAYVHMQSAICSATSIMVESIWECCCVWVRDCLYIWKNHDYNTSRMADQFSLLIVTCMEAHCCFIASIINWNLLRNFLAIGERPKHTKPKQKTVFAHWMRGRTHRDTGHRAHRHTATHLWPLLIWRINWKINRILFSEDDRPG